MRFDLIDHLPFVKIILINEGKESELANVLLDTGSASTVIPAEIAVELGLDSLPTDKILRIHGVGGMEYVYEKHIDKITLGSLFEGSFEFCGAEARIRTDYSCIWDAGVTYHLAMNPLKCLMHLKIIWNSFQATRSRRGSARKYSI